MQELTLKEYTPEVRLVTEEIIELKREAQIMALKYAIKIGERLSNAKSLLPHGAWSDWLKNEVDFSQSTANNFMKLYEEYGTDQISIFATSKSQSFENLPYTKALKLLAIPADEREEFAEAVDVENLSVKELEAAIKERDEALEQAKAEKAKTIQLEEALAKAERTAADAQAANDELETLKAKAEKAERSRDIAKDKLKRALENPKLPPEKLEQIKKEAEKAASESAEKKYSEELKEAQEKAERAEKEKRLAEEAAKAAQRELEETQRRLKTASPDVTTFKHIFDSMQKNLVELRNILKRIKENDPVAASGLEDAIKALGENMLK